MKYSNTVEYNIKTSLDSKGLTQLKSELQGLELKLQNMGNKGFLDEKTFVDARNQIQGLGQALTDAFNPSLGMLDLSKLNQELKSNDVTAQGLKTAFSSLGAEGQVAFNNLVGELGKLDTGILRTNSQIDKLFTTFSNTFRWGLVSSFFSQFMNAIHSSVDYVKELDDSLTQIMLVTDYNRDSMNEFARSANEAAKAVSMTTTGMTNASLIFAQQGYGLGQSQELATLSAKLANASQQDTATTSDQITAYMNAYGLENSIGELTQAMDNWALIANISAADVGELAQASQRAASMANTVGVSGEQLAAQIATIESVTREAPEQIGNGLKTLYARFSDISAGGEDEDGISLGDVTKQLNDIGVQVLDQFGNIRDVGDIMEDLMVVWDDLDQTSKIAAAQSLAGKYQVNRFVSLMDNSDMYREYLGATGSSAAGTLDQMNEEYAQSIEGRSAKLQASLEGLFSTIFNTDDIYPWMDAAQGAIDLLQQFFDALGGGKTVLLGISSLLMQIFSKNMAQEINNAATNRAVQQQKLENLQNSQAALTTLGAANPNPNDANSQNILNFAQYMQANAKNFNAEQMNQANSILQELVQNSNAATMAADKLKDSLSVIGTGITATTGESILAPFLDSEGAVNATLLSEALQNMSQSEVADMFSHIQEDIKPAREGLLEFNKALQDYQQELRKTNSTDDNWNQSLANLRATLDNLQGKIDPSTYERYEQAVNEIAEVTDKAGDKTAETTAEVAKLADGLEKVAAKDLTNLDQLNKDAFQAKNTQMAAEDSNKVAGAFQEGMGSQAHIQEILNTLNAVQQLTFAWQAFQNLGSLWANEDLSTGEKVLQTIMNLTMAMPQLITAMDTLKTSDTLKNVGENLLQSLDFSKNGQKGLFAKEQFDELVSAATKGREAMDAVKFAGRNMSDEIRQGLEKTIAEGALAEDALTKIGPELLETSMVGTTGLEAIKASLAGLATSAKAFLAEFWPLLLIGAAVAGISALIGAAQEQAEQAHQEAISAFEDAKNAQQQVADLSTKIDEWKSKRQTGGDNEELAKDADTLADSLRELDKIEEANAVHLAAIRTETKGTADSFNELENALDAANQSMSDQSALDAMNAANAVLRDRLSTEEEIADAQNALQSAALDYNLNQISRTNGMEMGVLNVAGNEDLRAATMDWQSLNSILEQSVPGFKEITDENERLSLALAHTSDEAQRAAIEIQQVLNANSSLSSSRTVDYGAGDIGNFNERGAIVQQLENTGLSAEESLQLLVTVDDSSYDTMTQDIQTVMEHLNGGEPFDVALKAIMDEQETEDYIKAQLAAYEPTDEDIDADAFKNMASYIQEADSSAFEEGGMLEDVSPEIQNNAEALEDLVEGILRYDDAVSTLNDNEEKWRDALSDNADLQDRAEAVADLKETYSDFLDLGTDVSDQFAENTDNLDLMAEAAQGDVDAYNELLAAASEDIAVNVYGIDESSAALQQMSDYLQSDAFQDVEIGMAIDDQAFYDALNQMSADAGWTAEDMESYLSDIGCSIDPSGFEETANSLVEASNQTGKAEAENLTVTSTTEISSETGQEANTTEYTSAIADVDTITGTSVLPVTAGNLGTLSGGAQPSPVEIPYSIPSVRYTAVPISKTDIQEKTGFAVNTEAKQGGGGTGGVQVKRGSVKKSNSGGAKNRNASSPRSSGGGGGGGKGKSCFVAGTLISTSFGFKPIEQIQKGNIVLSYNELSHQNEYSIVLQTMIHDTIEPIYTLYIKDEQLRVTSIHRFLVIDKITCGAPQWIHAADLHVGQWVLFADGTWHVIHKIEVNIEHQTVYNFEVSGNHNYYVGRNQILAHNKGGKGGGGGGGKAKTIENKEKKEHEKDYYEEVKSQLDKTEKILSGIEKEEDRLIGDKARANQNKQLKLLQKEIDLQTKKLKILTEQEKRDVAAALQKSDKEAEKILQKYAMITLPNPEFDEDGMIANYEQMSAAIDAAHNRLIEEYNKAAAAGNEERTKEIQKEIDKFDKLGESILKNAKRSNEIQTEIEEINNTIEELNDSIEDIRIDAYKASQEALDNLKDIKESAAELNKLFRDFDDSSFGMNRWSIDDTPYGDLIENLSKLDEMYGITAESAGNFYDELIAQKKAALAATTDADEQDAISRAIQFFEEQKAQLSDTDSLSNGLLGLSQQDLARLQEWMDNPGAANNPFGENTSALFDAYQDAYERTLSLFKDYRETIQDTRDTILDIYDETEESIERQMDQYDRLIEKVERISDTYTLYYGEDSYDQLDQFYARQGDIMQSQLDKLTDAYNYWQDQYEKAVAIGDEKLIQEVQDRMDDAEDAMLDAAQELAELWVEKFENAVEASSQHIYKDLFGTGDIEELTDNWELQKDYMERYRDDVEKAYEVDKLRNKYLDLLDTAQGSSVQTQNRIRQQMQEQLDLLQNQATVSEYDVKLANAKLEILQKQIALEDAQRNKNKMQLRRDTQGNYRYVYTADQGDVRQAQQNLEDSEYDAYEMTKQETLTNNDRAINMLQDYIQKRAAIWNKYKDDSAARAEALANLESEYSKIFDALREDFSDTSEGMIDVLNWLVQNGTENTTNAAIDMLHTLYDENGKVKDKTGQDWMDMATLIQDQVLPEIEDSVTKANLEMEKHAEDLKESMTGTDGALTKIGSGASDVEDSMTKAADATNKLATATKALFAALGADKGELQAALDKLVDYEKQLHSTQQTTSQLSTQLGQANKTIAAKNAEAQNYRTILDLKSGVKDFKKGEEYTIKKGTWVWYDRDGAFQMDSEGAKGFAVPEDVKVKIMTDYLTMGDRQAYYPVTIYPTDQAKWGKHLADFEGEEGKRTRRQQDWHIGIETFRNALKYDTGGYTGDWKDQTQDVKNGKLALLHQKELVLNATDTENILAAVNIVREVAKAVKISAGYVSALNTNAYPLNNKDTIQQRVEISATFPNATDADDIRNALIGLSDKAYQYAHRTI